MKAQSSTPVEHAGLLQRIRYSIFPGTRKEREGYRNFFNTLILHFRPRTVPQRTLQFTLTWGLGGMAFVLVMILIGTGLLLKFVYQPFPDRAYESILHLQNEVLFGQLIRNIHYWSANLVIIVAFLHFLRVYFTGAFHPPRQFNWVIGLGLFSTVFLSNFTGYLLPWDQLAFWAITISTGMLEYVPIVGIWLQRWIQGGAEVGPATLSTFYAIHTAILPAAFIILMPFHFWRVRKAGGLVILRSPKEDENAKGEWVPAIPNLLLREVVVALAATALILLLSVALDAPLQSKANPGLSPNPTKAPWYFMGIQEMLLHFHPLFALFIIPILTVIVLAGLPYLNYQSHISGVWFVSSKARRMARMAVLVALLATPLVVLTDESMGLTRKIPGLPSLISTGVIPFGILVVAVWGFYGHMKRRHRATNTEAVQMIFVLIAVALIVVTLTGIFFRGAGMKLVWP
jgi:quinol-cytochrome oxidoreductase complex cytochrome b subunit